MSLIAVAVALPWLIVALFVALGAWIGFQLIHQNGRLLSRLETMEARLGERAAAPARAAAPPAVVPPIQNPHAQRAPEIQNQEGPPLGSPAPPFELPDLNGEWKSLTDFRGRKLLLIFFNPRCGFCTRMAPDLAALPMDGANGAPLPLVVSTGDPEENRRLVAEHGLRCPVLLQGTMEVGAQYHCHGTPMGYLLDEQGRIASAMAVGAQALLALVGGASREAPDASSNGHAALGGKRPLAESKIARSGLPAGTPAPAFTLPRLGGGALSLSEYRGRKLLLVFSDPNCGPCSALMPRLEEAYRRSGEVAVVMVSRGEAEANEAKVEEHGLTFPVALQRQWEISREYGMFATPIAYLIDEAGVIAADVAVGVEPILALLASASAWAPGAEGRCRCGKRLEECGCAKEKPAAIPANGR